MASAWVILSSIGFCFCGTFPAQVYAIAMDENSTETTCEDGVCTEAEDHSLLQMAQASQQDPYFTDGGGGTDVAVDGGFGRACRGDYPSDNDASYYYLTDCYGTPCPSWQSCSDQCSAKRGTEQGCQGFEWSPSGNRCELWKRPPMSSTDQPGFVCGRYQPPLPKVQVGGFHQACRRNNPSDNSESYYELAKNTYGSYRCELKCLADVFCYGFEYSPGYRCELWNVEPKSSTYAEAHRCYKIDRSR